MGTQDLDVKVSCSVQHGSEFLMTSIDSGLETGIYIGF